MKKLAKLVFASILAIGLIPALTSIFSNASDKAITAHAGSGTGEDEEHPFYPSTFREFRDALDNEDIHRIIVNDELDNINVAGYHVVTKDDMAGSIYQVHQECAFYITGDKHITFNHDIKIDCKNILTIKRMFEQNSDTTVTLDGDAVLRCELPEQQYNASYLYVVSRPQANLVINGNLTFNGNQYAYGNREKQCVVPLTFSSRRGNLTINGGTFIGFSKEYPTFVESQAIDLFSKTCNFADVEDRPKITINGGTFKTNNQVISRIKSRTSIKILSQDKFDPTQQIFIKGGTFEGFCLVNYLDDPTYTIADLAYQGYEFVLADTNEAINPESVLIENTIRCQPDGKQHFNVTFDGNGADSGSVSPIITDGPKVTLPDQGDLYHSTLTFRGWAMGSPSGDVHGPGEEIFLTGDTVFYAFWDEKELIPIYYYDNYEVGAQQINQTFVLYVFEGSEIEIRTYEECGFKNEVGKKFNYWVQQYTHEHRNPGDKVTVPNESLVFVAENINYGTVRTIHFDPNPSEGGHGDGYSIKVYNNTTFYLPENTEFTNDAGASFKGWMINDELYKPYHSLYITEDIYVYAAWYQIEEFNAEFEGFAIKDHDFPVNNLALSLVYDDGEIIYPVLTDFKFVKGDDPLGGDVIEDISSYQFDTVGTYQITVVYILDIGFNKTLNIKVVDSVYEVDYEPNGGSGPLLTYYVEAGEEYTLPDCMYDAPDEETEFYNWSVKIGAAEPEPYVPGDKLNLTEDAYVIPVWGPKISYISISGDYKTEYELGESFDSTGIEITAHYYDDSTEDISLNDVVFTGFDSSSAGNKVITVTFAEYSDTFNITVFPERYNVTYVLNGGTGNEYVVSNVFEHTLLQFDELGITPDDGLYFDYYQVKVGEEPVINKNPGESIDVTADTVITPIWKNQLVSITVTGYKTEYELDESFDSTGIVVTAHYSDNTELPIDLADVEFSSLDSSILGTTDITATYQSVSYTFHVIITEVKYTVTYTPNGGTGVDYVINDVFNGSNHTLLKFVQTGFVAPEGKVFDCWIVNGEDKQPGQSITITQDTVIQAKWKDIPAVPEYVVSFSFGEGGSGEMVQLVKQENSSYTLPENGFTAPENKEFAGWKVNGTGELLQPGAKITITADVELVAQWKDVEQQGGGETPVTPVDPATPTPDTSSDTPSEPQNTEKKGLSGGAIAGIVVGSTVVAGVGGFALVWFVLKKKTFADLLALFSKK